MPLNLPRYATPSTTESLRGNLQLSRSPALEYLSAGGTGAATGASIAGGYGALAGAALGLLGKGVERLLNREAINEQNAYNSPASQMARYRAAGLNPNLIYGNGVSSAGNQQAIAEYRSPEIPSDAMQGIGVALSLVNSVAEARKNVAEAKRAEAGASIDGIRADTFELLNDYQLRAALGKVLNQDQYRAESASRIPLNVLRSRFESKTFDDRVTLLQNQALMSSFEQSKQGTDWWLDKVTQAIGTVVGAIFGVGGAIGRLRKSPIVVPKGAEVYYP